MRKIVLYLAALIGVAVVVGIFVSSRKTMHETAAPPVDAHASQNEQRAELEPEVVPEASATNAIAERVEVRGPIVDNIAAEEGPPRLRFIVVDELTLQPIESFGLRLSMRRHPDASLSSKFVGLLMSAVDVVAHPGGVCDLAEQTGAPGYQIEAPGHAPQEGWIEPAAHTTNAQTIRLARGGSISARVMLENKPARIVNGRLRRAVLNQDRVLVDRYDLEDFLGRTRFVTQLKSGELLFDDLATGTYALEVRSTRGIALEIERVIVVEGRDTPLGDLFLAPNPVVNFTVLFPEQRIPKQFRVTVKCEGRGTSGRIDAAGKFTINDLPSGHWKVSPPVAEGFVAVGPPVEFDIAAGNSREITLDLRDRGGFWLDVAVRVNGRPASGVVSTARSAEAAPIELRPTDANGKTRGWLSAGRACTVFVMSRSNMPLTPSAVEVAPHVHAQVTANVDVEAGELNVHWTDLDKLTDAEYESLSIEPTQTPSRSRSYSADSGRFFDPTIRYERHRELGFIAAGEYRVTLCFNGAGPSRAGRLKYSKIVVIRAAEVCELRFTREDLVQ